MNIWTRQNIIKLQILTSLAKSQKALAKIIDQIAEVTTTSPDMANHLQDNIETISRYQRILAMKICGIRIGSVKKGIPKQPWLNNRIGVKRERGGCDIGNQEKS